MLASETRQEKEWCILFEFLVYVSPYLRLFDVVI